MFDLTMEPALSPALALLQVAATQISDTLIVREVLPPTTWWQTVTSIASGMVSIALMVLTVALVPAAWNFRKSYARINELLKRVESDVKPIMRHGSNIADNLDYISTSLRTDIQKVSETIDTANRRLQVALDTSERRVRELNALLRVVQDEAEDVFVSAASTARGVRVGAEVWGDAIRRGEDVDLEDGLDDDLGGFSNAHDEYDEPPDVLSGLPDPTGEEDWYGDDSEDGADATRRPGGGPRIRPRGS